MIARDDVPIAKGHVGADDTGHVRDHRLHRRLPARHAGVADVQGTVRLADGVLKKIVIEPDGKEYRDPPAEERAGVAMQ